MLATGGLVDDKLLPARNIVPVDVPIIVPRGLSAQTTMEPEMLGRDMSPCLTVTVNMAPVEISMPWMPIPVYPSSQTT